jgi:hypothetical protein
VNEPSTLNDIIFFNRGLKGLMRQFPLKCFFSFPFSSLSRKKAKIGSTSNSNELPNKRPLLTEEQLASLKSHRETMTVLRKKYAEEMSHLPTKSQAILQKKHRLKQERDTNWEAYLNELRPKLAKIPPGITSIRKSLIALERKPPPIQKSEEERVKGMENFIEARSKIVNEKRKRVLDWYRELLPRVIKLEEIDEAIKQAYENPKNPNIPIEDLINLAKEKKRRIAEIKPHTHGLSESSIIVKPNRDY